MLHSSILVSSAAPAGALLAETIASRFGDITVDAGKSILFQRGMLGMPDKTNFVLANFPSDKMQQFKLLQSLDEPQLSFITLPIEIENTFIQANDLRIAAHEMQIAEANLATLLIVSVHRTPSSVKLSVNTRAPLMLDATRRVGVQHVIPNEAYKIQHML